MTLVAAPRADFLAAISRPDRAAPQRVRDRVEDLVALAVRRGLTSCTDTAYQAALVTMLRTEATRAFLSTPLLLEPAAGDRRRGIRLWLAGEHGLVGFHEDGRCFWAPWRAKPELVGLSGPDDYDVSPHHPGETLIDEPASVFAWDRPCHPVPVADPLALKRLEPWRRLIIEPLSGGRDKPSAPVISYLGDTTSPTRFLHGWTTDAMMRGVHGREYGAVMHDHGDDCCRLAGTGLWASMYLLVRQRRRNRQCMTLAWSAQLDAEALALVRRLPCEDRIDHGDRSHVLSLAYDWLLAGGDGGWDPVLQLRRRQFAALYPELVKGVLAAFLRRRLDAPLEMQETLHAKYGNHLEAEAERFAPVAAAVDAAEPLGPVIHRHVRQWPGWLERGLRGRMVYGRAAGLYVVHGNALAAVLSALGPAWLPPRRDEMAMAKVLGVLRYLKKEPVPALTAMVPRPGQGHPWQQAWRALRRRGLRISPQGRAPAPDWGFQRFTTEVDYAMRPVSDTINALWNDVLTPLGWHGAGPRHASPRRKVYDELGAPVGALALLQMSEAYHNRMRQIIALKTDPIPGEPSQEEAVAAEEEPPPSDWEALLAPFCLLLTNPNREGITRVLVRTPADEDGLSAHSKVMGHCVYGYGDACLRGTHVVAVESIPLDCDGSGPTWVGPAATTAFTISRGTADTPPGGGKGKPRSKPWTVTLSDEEGIDRAKPVPELAQFFRDLRAHVADGGHSRGKRAWMNALALADLDWIEARRADRVRRLAISAAKKTNSFNPSPRRLDALMEAWSFALPAPLRQAWRHGGTTPEARVAAARAYLAEQMERREQGLPAMPPHAAVAAADPIPF